MYERMKCPACKQNLFSPVPPEECKEPNHVAPGEVVYKKDAPLYVWNFRYGRMVDIETHNLIEGMAGRK
jgi:hypothetical protein